MNIIREFKAKIVDDFKEAWVSAMAEDERRPEAEIIADYGGHDLDAFHQRIAGREVIILEYSYWYGENAFFEKEDDNFVMPSSVWEEI